MAMLAEPRRKQRWMLNPRGKQWSEDSNKFGQKMLEKMGWSSGKGLGRNMDGMTEHIRAKYKNDQAGVGFSSKDAEKQWTRHQAGFNELLQQLQGAEEPEAIAKENDLSGKSLELKSKQSRARVHYQKFTRGKDVNKYSTKDLANIFGKKDLTEKPENEELNSEAVGSSNASYGILTITGGSIVDYFKHKMSALGCKTVNDETNHAKSDSESEEERHVGFGFVEPREDLEKTIEKKNFSFENPALEIENSPEVDSTPGKLKNNYIFENPALDVSDSPKEVEHTSKLKQSAFAFENAGLDLETPEERTPSGSIKKYKMRFVQETRDEASPMNTEQVESAGKKKRKKKSSDVSEGFTNEALNLEARDVTENATNVSLFEVPRSNFGLANDGLDLTDESSGKKRVTFNETVEYENDTGSSRGKKRKNRNGKLDKFEVDNEKLRKKRKKEKKSDIVNTGGAFTNEGMDVEFLSQEVNDNAVNERKMERERKKRERRISNLETIEEAPEEDKEESSNAIEVVTLDETLVIESSENSEILIETPRPKKKKKKGKNKQTKNIEEDENLSDTLGGIEIIEEILSREIKNDGSGKKRKERKTEETEVTSIEIISEESEKKTKKRKREVVTNEANIIEDCSESPDATRESKPKRMKKKSSKRLDKENVEITLENVESGESEKKQKKKKRSKTFSNDVEIKEESIYITTTENEATNSPRINDKSIGSESVMETVTCQAELPIDTSSPWDGKGKKSKRIFKALFAKSPVLNFTGSNINEIKGYGMNYD